MIQLKYTLVAFAAVAVLSACTPPPVGWKASPRLFYPLGWNLANADKLHTIPLVQSEKRAIVLADKHCAPYGRRAAKVYMVRPKIEFRCIIKKGVERVRVRGPGLNRDDVAGSDPYSYASDTVSDDG